MKSFVSSMQILSVLVILSISGCVFCRGETDEVKIRRGGSGTAGLFAFPRVGRRDPSMMEYNPWDNVLPYTYEEYDMDGSNRINEGKRANLMPFPRVGRPDNDFQKLASKLAAYQQQEQEMEKRTGANPNNGLWFGPRLGKRGSHSATM